MQHSKQVLLVLTLAALLTACGGGGGGSSGTAGVTPQADPFMTFVQDLSSSSPEDNEPETVTGVVVSSTDTDEPLDL